MAAAAAAAAAACCVALSPSDDDDKESDPGGLTREDGAHEEVDGEDETEVLGEADAEAAAEAINW